MYELCAHKSAVAQDIDLAMFMARHTFAQRVERARNVAPVDLQVYVCCLREHATGAHPFRPFIAACWVRMPDDSETW